MRELAPLAVRLKVEFLSQLLSADTPEHLAKLVTTLGQRNLLELIHFMGEKEIIHLLQRYKAPKLEGLILLLNRMRVRKPKAARKKTPKKKKAQAQRKQNARIDKSAGHAV